MFSIPFFKKNTLNKENMGLYISLWSTFLLWTCASIFSFSDSLSGFPQFHVCAWSSVLHPQYLSWASQAEHQRCREDFPEISFLFSNPKVKVPLLLNPATQKSAAAMVLQACWGRHSQGELRWGPIRVSLLWPELQQNSSCEFSLFM